jgi:dipeptidyl aminopeptidase/acylaminoacyl peptidase
MSLKPREKARVIAGYTKADVESVFWVNDERLIFDATSFDRGVVVQEGESGLLAINADGSGVRQIAAWQNVVESSDTRIKNRVLNYEWGLYRTLDDGSGDVLMARTQRDNLGEPVGLQLVRVNTVTGIVRNLGAGAPAYVRSWVVDAAGEPRVATAEQGGRIRSYLRLDNSEQWAQIQDEDSLSSRAFDPLLLEPDGQLLVRSAAGRGFTALYAYDPKQRVLDPEPLAALPGFDLGGDLEYDSKTLSATGLHFRADRPMTIWFDEKLQTLQKELDAALPAGRFNRLSCGRCATSSHVLIHSRSDTQPGEFYLFDRASRKLESLGTRMARLPESAQGRRTYHRVKARDGLSLPVYVTHPQQAKDKESLPAVVLVHGGPWVRGADRGWRAEPQFLASLGYRVLEPEFRGSTGYGSRHFTAGLKQWGEAMQDDLADTVAWAAEQGLVDPRRVCIMGASYGGYAALMSPIRHPETYRCAIAFAAVTDLILRYKAWGSDLSDEGKRYGLPKLMGDPDKDEALLKASSPLLRVAEIKIPLLVAHGAEDRRVPIEHAEKFVAAARKAGVPTQYKVYDREGHGWVLTEDEADFMQRVQGFLAQHLGGRPQP